MSLGRESVGTQGTPRIEAVFEEEATTPFWWAWIDSGMLTNSMFLLAEICYLWAIYDYNFDWDEEYPDQDEKHWKNASWLWLWAALLFLVESMIDFLWSFKVLFVERRLRKAKLELAHTPRATEASRPSAGADRPSAGLLDSEGQALCCPWFDEIPWGLWSALFFVIPSCLYLAVCFFDPYVVVWHWLNWSSMSDADYAELLSEIAAYLFLFDSLLGLAGRYSIRRQVPADDQLSLAPWTASGFFTIDWAAYGDTLFFIGAIVGVIQQVREYNQPLDWVTNGLWALDAVFYMFASYPVLRTLLKNRTLPATRPSA